MWPPFALLQTCSGISGTRFGAEEMLMFVEEYLLGSDLVFESQKRLDLDEFREQVSDEGVAVDDVQLLAREERQVAPQVFHVARVYD